MRTLIIGTSGQLALELRAAEFSEEVQLRTPEKVDLADERAVTSLLENAAPELIINAGAYTAVDRAETERERAFSVNALGPAVLAKFCRRRGGVLIHISTDYVFDGEKRQPYVESDAPNPLNVYGASKLAGESAIREQLEEHVILRTSWVFSGHGHNFLTTILRLARERDELRIVGDQIGRPTPARDLARVIATLAGKLRAERRLAWGTYHFAGAGSASWHAFAEEIVAAQACFTERRPRVLAILSSEYPTAARRPSNSVLATTAFERTFGLSPQPWRAAVARTVEELLARCGDAAAAQADQ